MFSLFFNVPHNLAAERHPGQILRSLKIKEEGNLLKYVFVIE